MTLEITPTTSIEGLDPVTEIPEPLLDYRKVLSKNMLHGDYEWGIPWYQDDDFDTKRMIRGDLRRFEENALKDDFLDFVEYQGVSRTSAEIVIRALLGIAEPGCNACAEQLEKTSPVIERCEFHRFKPE